MLAPLWLVAKFTLLVAGLLLPGAAIMRALRIPGSVATWFAGSVVALYTTVLALQLSGVAISLASLATGLALITAAAVLARPVSPGKPSIETLRHLLTPFSQMGGWTPLYLLAWAAILLRAGQNPLAGPDIEFRWSFLAEQMLRHGSLDFYPPRSAADFLRYFWVESIPPGASALHAWAFACAGVTSAAWTLPALILQVWSLHEVVWRATERFAGIPAARFACVALTACPLLTWAALLGQETGLTALSLAGIAFALLGWQETEERGWAVLAGVFATIGAAAREYGLVFPVLAAGGLLAARADRRAWLGFGLVAALGFVWPLRTFALTGNPIYSLGVGGVFPINARFVAWIEHDAAALGGVLTSTAGWLDIGRYLLLFAPTALIGWAALGLSALRGSRPARWGFGAVVIVLTLWAASVRYTNGGLFYSLRVMSPALALGCIAAGTGFASRLWFRRGLSAVPNMLLIVFAVTTLLPTLALPQSHRRTPWREWPAFAAAPAPAGETDETVAAIRRALAVAAPGKPAGLVLADSPGYQRRFAATGIGVIPLWSPQADCLFDATLAPAEAARRWRESGITHVVITKWQDNLDFFNQRSRWSRPPFQPQLIAETGQTLIFSLRTAD